MSAKEEKPEDQLLKLKMHARVEPGDTSKLLNSRFNLKIWEAEATKPGEVIRKELIDCKFCVDLDDQYRQI